VKQNPQSLALAWLLPPAIFLFVLPFAYMVALRWSAGGITLTIALWQWRRGPEIPAIPCKAAIAFWAGSLLLSLVWAANPALSASELKVDVAYTLAIFLAFYVLTQSAREFQVWLIALAKGSFVVSLLAVGYFAWFGEWVIGYQNALGQFATCMVTALPAIVLLTLRGMPWSTPDAHIRWILPVMLVAGVLTLSRMFFGALVLMLLIAAALLYFRRRLHLRRSAVIVGIACLAAIAAVMMIAEQRNIRVVEDQRPAIWSLAWHQIQLHPWTGTGYGFLVDRQEYEKVFPDMGIWHPHNLLLAYAEQAGVFGALAIVVLFLALGRAYWRLYRQANEAVSTIGIAGLAMVAGVLAKNMTDMFFVRECALLFWSLNGILLGYGLRATASTTGATPAEVQPG
jgi:O-antigen ligase